MWGPAQASSAGDDYWTVPVRVARLIVTLKPSIGELVNVQSTPTENGTAGWDSRPAR